MSIFFKIAQIVIPTTPVADQRGLSLGELASIVAIIGSFLTNIAAIGAVIAIVVSGIMYMKAGSNTSKITEAQTWLKNALIGAFIVLAVGMIINTIANVVSRAFFCQLSVFGYCVF
jgi:hypothetical protein